MKKTEYYCDACGALIPQPKKVAEMRARKFSYRVIISRRDNSRIKGAYVPPYRTCSVCEKCLAFTIVGLFNKEEE